MSYRAPVRELVDCLFGPAGFGSVMDGHPSLDRDTVVAILEAAGVFAEEALAPLNAVGDRCGATLNETGVTAAPGFAAAYAAFSRDGWNGLAADPVHGGQGLPKAVAMAVFEIVQAANMAFALCPMLTQAAVEALAAHGSARQRALYLPRLVAGEWTGAMALTESEAGSDLSVLTTRAEPDGLGGYRLHGQKIFITWGDHDCAANIVHLVLARLPDAPPGVKGISLFLCSKRLVDEEGSLGEANTFKAVGLEHKLGIHGSPTCVIQYDGARAELVGQANQGLPLMFTMMNAARLQVGVQGVAIAERAFQQALYFAMDRRQGRSAFTGESPAPLFDHPDIRRTLMLMKARIRGGRALCLATAVAADLSLSAPDAVSRESARLREEFLTPIAKAWCTDMGVEAASQGLQIHGGAGYIEETGAAQPYRDARIAPIYEGTNGIQAIDLAFRKLGMAQGRALRELLEQISVTAQALAARPEPDLRRIGARLQAARAEAEAATGWFAAEGRTAGALAGATPLLTLIGDLIAGDALARDALARDALTDARETKAAADGLPAALAMVFAETVLASAAGLASAATLGAGVMARITGEALRP